MYRDTISRSNPLLKYESSCGQALRHVFLYMEWDRNGTFVPLSNFSIHIAFILMYLKASDVI